MKFYQKMITVAIAALMMFSTVLSAQTFMVDSEASTIKWNGKKVTGEHHGTIDLSKGKFVVDGDNMSGKFKIDMSTIAVTDIPAESEYNAKLTGHLKSADFFNVEEHPTATFAIEKMEPAEASEENGMANYMVTGKLTIKGITNEISFPAKIEIAENSFNATAKVTVDRSKYDVRYGSGSFFEGLGDKLIYDDFLLHLNIVGNAGEAKKKATKAKMNKS